MSPASKDGDVCALTMQIHVHDIESRVITVSALATFRHYTTLAPYVAK